MGPEREGIMGIVRRQARKTAHVVREILGRTLKCSKDATRWRSWGFRIQKKPQGTGVSSKLPSTAPKAHKSNVRGPLTSTTTTSWREKGANTKKGNCTGTTKKFGLGKKKQKSLLFLSKKKEGVK